MAKPTAPQCHALTTYYVKLFKNRYATEPVVNRHSARWGFESILMGMPPEEAKTLLEFYFSTASSKRHSLDWFFYNYDKLIESMRDLESDNARRLSLREESERRAAEWRAKGKKGLGEQ